MGKYSTDAEDRISAIKEKATWLEQERRKAYRDRLQELVVESANWHYPPEAYPLALAQRAFDLGRDFGAGKMYEYL